MNMSNQEVDPDDVGVLEGLDGGATTTSYVVATYFGFRYIDRLGRRRGWAYNDPAARKARS
jgi:hypothetical protein